MRFFEIAWFILRRNVWTRFLAHGKRTIDEGRARTSFCRRVAIRRGHRTFFRYFDFESTNINSGRKLIKILAEMNTPKAINTLPMQAMQANATNTPLRRRSALNLSLQHSPSPIESLRHVSCGLFASIIELTLLVIRLMTTKKKEETRGALESSTVVLIWQKQRIPSTVA